MEEMVSRNQVMAWEELYDSGVYSKQPIVLVRGAGARVWDIDGTEYIDCVGGHGAANLGHAHPAVVAAVTAQAQRLFLSPNGFYNDMRAQLLKELVRVAPPEIERAFLCSSGTEAVEAVLKFARLATKRTKIISTMRAFHGRTMGALSTTWNKEYREPFEPLIPDVTFVPYGKIDRMDKALDDQTAAVILEVVQGEGGVNPGDGEYLQQVQALCRERGALFIADEVQTGFGRTGKMFACEHYDLRPDLMAVAKSIAGGLPMGACADRRAPGRDAEEGPRQHVRRKSAGVRGGPGDDPRTGRRASAGTGGPARRAVDGRLPRHRFPVDPRGARPGADGRHRTQDAVGPVPGRAGGAGRARAPGGRHGDALPAAAGDFGGGYRDGD
jgi:acetylornithine/succinyldiaminopimelate/putrescine aminotransferase